MSCKRSFRTIVYSNGVLESLEDHKENALIWKKAVEQLKGHVIEATSQSKALVLEVDTLKQEEEEEF